jgi:hypothetical protein
VSAPPSVPLSIISLSLAAASITMLPEDVVRVTAPSPAAMSSAATLDPMYVLILEAATFLFVPPAASSIINKSASAMSAPMSVAPSISMAAIGNVPESPEPIKLPVAVGNVNTAELPAECAGPFSCTPCEFCSQLN